MVALPPVPGVAKVIIKQVTGGVNVFNVMHVANPVGASWSQAGLDGLATLMRQTWVTNVIPLQTSQLTLTDVQVVDLSSDTGVESVATGNTPGGSAAGIMAASTAVCWSWKISRRYRGGHPRTYIGGVVQTQVSGVNTLAVAAQTQHVNAAAAIRSAVNSYAFAGSTTSLVVVHYRRAKAILPVPLVSPITGVTVDSRLDSQRRRLGRDRS